MSPSASSGSCPIFVTAPVAELIITSALFAEPVSALMPTRMPEGDRVSELIGPASGAPRSSWLERRLPVRVSMCSSVVPEDATNAEPRRSMARPPSPEDTPVTPIAVARPVARSTVPSRRSSRSQTNSVPCESKLMSDPALPSGPTSVATAVAGSIVTRLGGTTGCDAQVMP